MAKIKQKIFDYKNLDFLINKNLGYSLRKTQENIPTLNNLFDRKNINVSPKDNIVVTTGKQATPLAPLQISTIGSGEDLVSIDNESIVTIESF